MPAQDVASAAVATAEQLAKQAAATTVAAGAAQLWAEFLHFDPVGDAPCGIKYDGTHARRKGRCFPTWKADDNSLFVDFFVLFDGACFEFGHVVPNVEFAQVLWQPAPAFHVVDDELNVALEIRLVDRVAIECSARAPADIAVRFLAGFALEFFYGFDEFFIVEVFGFFAAFDLQAFAEQSYGRIVGAW